MQIEKGTLVFVGEYVHPTNRFLSVHCPPVGRADDRGCGQCSMTDVFDRLLVFDMPRFVPTRALIGSGSDPASSHGEAVEAAPHIVTTRFGVSSLSNLSKATKSTNCKKASGFTGNQGSIPMMGSVSDNDDDDDDDDDSDGDEDDTVSSSDEVALPSGSRVATRRPSAVTQRISYKDDSSTSSEEERDSGPSKSKLTKASTAAKKTTTNTVPPRSRADKKTPLGKRGRGRHDDGCDGDSKVARHSLRRDTSTAAEPTVIVLDD